MADAVLTYNGKIKAGQRKERGPAFVIPMLETGRFLILEAGVEVLMPRLCPQVRSGLSVSIRQEV